MEDEAREARLLAVFNDLPDTDKDAVLALMERIEHKETVLMCGDQAGDAINAKW
jgi:cell division FtsZ-interacting protein ZapD